jgi:alkylation response protein AidB-like acyl-CoA dehydrogenase
MLKERTYPTGGQFLLEETDPSDVFTPEDFDEDQRMIAETVREFVETHVQPVLEEAEFGKNVMLGKKLLHEAGEAGILMVDVPERFEGLGAPKATSMIVSEYLAGSGSFSVTYGGHASIGTLPIVYFGTEDQKAKYLPDLAHGRLIGAYALTEPGSGSDALAAKTTARLSPEGDVYFLNGTKQYISNAAFADIFIVFAKVDGDKFTAFIVPRDTPGLTLGAEERKMGIRGSSTRAVILEDARVPVENVLGEIGKGHVIAFNILNVGRFKLGAGTLGGCKLVMREAIPYIKTRKQFGKALSEFGLIRAKVADVLARTFVCESMVYRTAGLMDRAIEGLDPGSADFERKVIDAIEEFSIECSMIKVFGSESLGFASDEGVQMLGGYGFCEDYPMERHYRDQRINRIFEGTNEINRMLVTGMILKKALKGELPFFAAAGKVAQEIAGPPAWEDAGEGGFLDVEAKLVASMKKAVLATVGFAAQKHGESIKDAQEILSDAADMVIETYACESGLLRARKKALAEGEAAAADMADMLTLYLHDAIDRVAKWGRNIAAASAEGDELRTMLAALRRLTKHDPVNRTRLHDAIASRAL